MPFADPFNPLRGAGNLMFLLSLSAAVSRQPEKSRDKSLFWLGGGSFIASTKWHWLDVLVAVIERSAGS